MKNEHKGRRWSSERQGETAQLLFRAHASEHGFSILDPYSASESYDVALQY